MLGDASLRAWILNRGKPMQNERTRQCFPGNAGPLLFLAALVVLLAPSPAHAYIGPGAGFALGGSLFAVFAAFLSALVLFLTWPIRLLFRMLRFVWRTVLG